MTQELAFEGLGGALEGFRTGNEPEEMMEALLRLHFVGWRSRESILGKGKSLYCGTEVGKYEECGPEW